ncbi:MAG: hypothetical protein ABJ004_02570 [Cyclobacteriaceae bacterium]
MYELLNNWKVVLLSLGGATTFWFFNALNKDYNAVISYPIEFQFARDSVVIMEPLPNTVTIDVSSGGWNLIRNTLFFNVTPIQVELENPTEISYFTRSSVFPLITDQLEGLEVNYMVTDTLYINIEKKKVKRLKPRIDSLKLSLEPGFRLTSGISILPDTIELIGPESFLDTLDTEYFLKFTEKDIDDPVDQSLEVIRGKRGLVSSTPEKVNVVFNVAEFERLSMMVQVEPVNFPDDSSVYLKENMVEVSFTIRKSQSEDFDASDFAITADLAMLNKSDSSVLAILIYYPENAFEVDLQPEYVTIGGGQ